MTRTGGRKKTKFEIEILYSLRPCICNGIPMLTVVIGNVSVYLVCTINIGKWPNTNKRREQKKPTHKVVVVIMAYVQITPPPPPPPTPEEMDTRASRTVLRPHVAMRNAHIC